MVRRVAALISLLGFAACNGAMNGDRVREQYHRSIYAGLSPLVTITNVAGAVRIEGWSNQAIDVAATKYGYDAADVHGIAIDFDASQEGLIAIKTRYDHGVHGGGVRYLVHVPPLASVQISNTAGMVEVVGVRGDVTVKTQAGEITVNAGPVGGNRSIDLTATTGAVNLSMASSSSATVQASSTIGDITSDFPNVTVRRENLVGARGGGTIGSGDAHVVVRTTTGAITLRQR